MRLIFATVFSTALLASAQAHAEQEIMMDIASIVSGVPRENVEISAQQLWVTSPVCADKDANIAKTAANYLAEHKLKAAAALANSSLEFICAFKDARNDWEDASVDGIADFLVESPKFNATYYQGNKLGEWQCEADEPLERSTIAALGLFNGHETLSWKMEAQGKVSLWLAPWKLQPSDAAKFTWAFNGEGWKIESICLATRI